VNPNVIVQQPRQIRFNSPNSTTETIRNYPIPAHGRAQVIQEANIRNPQLYQGQGFETIRDTGTFGSLANDKSETKRKFMYSSFEGAE